MKKIALMFFLCTILFNTHAQEQLNKINPDRLNYKWNARWISCPSVSSHDYGVFHFRKSFQLDQKPDSFIIHVSADNRYRLFVNGKSICWGPSRGDREHWNFETVDIAPFLSKGNNIVAAMVWNFGDESPGAQISFRTSFILQGNNKAEEIINSDKTWKVYHDVAYSSVANPKEVSTFVGPGDRIDGRKYPWSWEKADYNDEKWEAAIEIAYGNPQSIATDILWGLEQRSFPFMEEKLQRINSLRRSSGPTVHSKFLSGDGSLVIPAHSKVSMLLDQTFETNAYPLIKVSGGIKSEIKLSYAEALVDSNFKKGNRNVVEGKSLIGPSDIFIADGGQNRSFTTLWFRTFRYIELNITTEAEALVINDFYGTFVGYPFKQNASFDCSDSDLSKIYATGWHTARLCAMETYFDCPYYEQLQYVGDTRIQALISLNISGDDRLMRNAISQYAHSINSEGLTKSRYPCFVPQIIPPFSLFWIDMVHDFWMYKNDPDFVKGKLDGIKGILAWFEKKVDSKTGILGPLPYWNFVDWLDEWPWIDKTATGGVPEGVLGGGSSIITLQYIDALQKASQIFSEFGDGYSANLYKTQADTLIKNVRKNCWDDSRQLYADSPAKKDFSQHANTFAVLTNAIPKEKQKDFIQRVHDDKSLIQATTYFRFYLLRAMKSAGMGERYVDLMKPWKDMLDIGLSTFAEKPDPTRSDCHAWSASPTYEMIATVLGIEPEEPGFKTVRIEPHLGRLSWAKGKMPHPLGEIYLEIKRKGKTGLEGKAILPPGLHGNFMWNSKKIVLKPGENRLTNF